MEIIAINPIKSGGKRHEPGQSFDCADDVARALIASGDAEKAGSKSKAAAADDAKPEGKPEGKAKK